jgi:hypothetical protein
MGQSQSVYNKEQINSLCMLLENYVNSDGKIISGMIEALGLTELITVTQTSLASFMADHANYTYEKMISLPFLTEREIILYTSTRRRQNGG